MEYKWKALAVVSIGSLMGAIDASVLLIAFPTVARDLSASLVEMVWVLMIYIVMGTALVLSLSRVADLKGRKRLYNAGFVVFIAGSLLCGLSTSGPELVAFRGLQGVGGAMLVANSFAILTDAFPLRERGRAFGINSVVWGIGSVGGIILGGLILVVTSWRWIFWINLPIGLAATAIAYVVLRESVTPNPRETFDFPAAALFTGALAAFLFGITEGILSGWGAWDAALPMLLSGLLFAGFVAWEWRVSRDPILPFGLFSNRLFNASLAASVLQGTAIFATNFLLMVYFQGIRGIDVLTASYLLIPWSVGVALVGPNAGRLADRYGARWLSTAGLVVQGTALYLFTTITAATPLAVVAGFEALMGIGGGLFFPANTAAIMAGVPRGRYGVGSGVMMTLRNSSVALSYAIALLALTSRLPAGLAASIFGGTFTPGEAAARGLSPSVLSASFLVGMHGAFLLAAGLVALAAVFSLLRGPDLLRLEPGPGHRRTVGRPHSVRAGPPSEGPEGAADGAALAPPP